MAGVTSVLFELYVLSQTIHVAIQMAWLQVTETLLMQRDSSTFSHNDAQCWTAAPEGWSQQLEGIIRKPGSVHLRAFCHPLCLGWSPLQESQMVTTFQASHLALCRGRRDSIPHTSTEARDFSSRKLSSDFPKCQRPELSHACVFRPIAGTRNGAQSISKINQDSSPWQDETHTGRETVETWTELELCQGGRERMPVPTHSWRRSDNTHSYSRNILKPSHLMTAAALFRSSNQSTCRHNYMFKCISAGLLGITSRAASSAYWLQALLNRPFIPYSHVLKYAAWIIYFFPNRTLRQHNLQN